MTDKLFTQAYTKDYIINAATHLYHTLTTVYAYITPQHSLSATTVGLLALQAFTNSHTIV